jgi:hypothetical protein
MHHQQDFSWLTWRRSGDPLVRSTKYMRPAEKHGQRRTRGCHLANAGWMIVGLTNMGEATHADWAKRTRQVAAQLFI